MLNTTITRYSKCNFSQLLHFLSAKPRTAKRPPRDETTTRSLQSAFQGQRVCHILAGHPMWPWLFERGTLSVFPMEKQLLLAVSYGHFLMSLTQWWSSTWHCASHSSPISIAHASTIKYTPSNNLYSALFWKLIYNRLIYSTLMSATGRKLSSYCGSLQPVFELVMYFLDIHLFRLWEELSLK